MSRGFGQVQCRILEAFACARGQALSTGELCRIAYGDVTVAKKHRVAVLRALRSLARSGALHDLWREDLRYERSDDLWYEFRWLPLKGPGRAPVR